jgi:hemerythrin-like domain-containing protein
MDAIAQLLNEHAPIMEQLAGLRAVVSDIARMGESALPGARPILERASRLIDVVLARHARKEEEALFPIMERVIGAAGPTMVMRREHHDIHDQGEILRATLRELNEIEHPLLEASGGRLRHSLAEGASAATFQALAGRILDLVDTHFHKEEQVLFPMAQQLLIDSELEEVAAIMRAIDEGGERPQAPSAD